MNGQFKVPSTASVNLDYLLMPPPLHPAPRPQIHSPPEAGHKQQSPKQSPDEESRLRKELRRARNRLAARKCRDRKYAHMAAMREALESLHQENQAREEEIAQLKDRRNQLLRMMAAMCYQQALSGGDEANVPVVNALAAQNSGGDILNQVDVQMVHYEDDTPSKILVLTCLGTAFTLEPTSPTDLTPVEVTYVVEEEQEANVGSSHTPENAK